MDREKRTIIDNEHWLWIWLLGVSGIGYRRLYRLLKAFGSATKVWNSSSRELMSKGVSTNLAKKIEASKEIFIREKTAIQSEVRRSLVIPLFSDLQGYPKHLHRFGNRSPPILWANNRFPDSETNVAVVGSRITTGYGREAAAKVMKQLIEVSKEVTIISGLAYGIDSIAHQMALDNEMKTVAVLGSGIAQKSGWGNRALGEKIWERGIVVSQFMPSRKASEFTFPVRNKVMAALSDLVIVVQAGEDSGALITAREAKKLDIPVYAVPGKPEMDHFKGSNEIIQEGTAKMIRDYDEIGELVGGQRVEKNENFCRKLNSVEARVIQVIKNGVGEIDQIALVTGLVGNKLFTILSRMEYDGIIQQNAGEFSLA